MAMKRCPVCGEKYSDTYRDCPFCEEEEALREGEKLRRSRGGRRAVARSRQFSLITPTLIVLILIMAGLLVYLLYGDQLAEKFRKDDEPVTPPTEDVTPVKPTPTQPEEPMEEPTEEPQPTEEPGTMPEEPTPGTSTAELDYDAIMALPSGLSLSSTDFTLKQVGESHTIKASGGSGSYAWASEDDGIASVDGSGKVTAISKGTVNVVVSDGSKKAVCIVRCDVAAGGQSTASGTTSSASGSLKAGAAKVINGGNGVRVRSGPGTSYDILATVSNGGSVRIVESAGDGWYKITFSDVGGATTSGYMKGDFLQNT